MISAAANTAATILIRVDLRVLVIEGGNSAREASHCLPGLYWSDRVMLTGDPMLINGSVGEGDCETTTACAVSTIVPAYDTDPKVSESPLSENLTSLIVSPVRSGTST